jgi:hypothetical protein
MRFGFLEALVILARIWLRRHSFWTDGKWPAKFCPFGHFHGNIFPLRPPPAQSEVAVQPTFPVNHLLSDPVSRQKLQQ